ncbi:MAG: TonB-dependent receptor [bacterium]|nr:MAG: TonB-dependent receptor [bacterium]
MNIYKNFKFSITLILVVSNLVFTQSDRTGTITGTVVDARTKEVLIGVNVLLVGTNKGSSTDENGVFTIEDLPFGTYGLEFNYIGYTTLLKSDVVVKQAKPAVIRVELIEGFVEGEEVTVTAGYFIEEMMTQTSTLGLSREEIRRFPGGFEDVVRTVSTLPGVAINTGAGRNDLLVRGGGPSENLYVIENIEVPNINHFGTQGFSNGSLSFVNLDYVDNVSFSTGGFKARHGDKMSSVLNLLLADGRKDRLGGKLLISATQYGLNLEGPVGKGGNFIFSARQSYLDLIFKAAGLPFVPVYTDFNLSLKYDITSRDKLYFIGLTAIDRVNRDQSTEENRVTNATLLDNTQNQYITGLKYRRLLDHGYIDVIMNLNLFQYRFDQLDENEIKYFKSAADEQEFNIHLVHFWSISNKVGLNTGAAWKNVSNQNETIFADTIYDRSGNRIAPSSIGLNQINILDTTARKISAFSELDWLVSPLFAINAGVRFDYYSFIEQSLYVSPRIAIKYKAWDKNTFRISGGIYYQSPSYVWVVNSFNRGLKALRNDMVVLGWDYLIQNDLRLSVEGYYKKYRDLPTGIIPEITDYIVQTNTGTGYGGNEDDYQSFGYYDMVSDAFGNAYGLDILLQKKFSEIPCYGQASFTLGKSKYTAGNGLRYPGQYDQRFIFNLSGGYIFNKNWEISAKFRLFSGVPYTPVYRPTENPTQIGNIQNLPEEYLSARLKTAHHLDVRVDRFFYLGNWTLILFVDIQNIYNYKVPQRPRYDFWADEITTTSEIGILPSIGFSAQF